MTRGGFLTDPGVRKFLLIWSGQFVSRLGSGLTGFALGVWIYERSGSVTYFAATMLSTLVPGIVLVPLAGMLVDRWDRRRTVMLCDFGRSLGTLTIAILLITGKFAIWSLCLTLAVSASFGVFKGIASTAMVAMLIPKRHFGRASGLLQLMRPSSRVFSPMIAGVLLALVGIEGVILIDFLTFVLPIATLFFLHVPNPKASREGQAAGGSFWRRLTHGWSFIRERRPVVWLLAYFALLNLTMGLAHALYRPLLLNFTSVEVVGVISSVGAAGVVLGSIVLTVWGGPERRVEAILAFAALYAVGLVATGLTSRPLVIGVALFGLIFGLPIIYGCMRMIWMRKTPADMQGRVFAVWTVIGRTTVLLAYVVAGPLADQLFEPLMTSGGALAATAGQLLGTGPGRGIGLLYVLLGVGVLAATATAYLHPTLRRLEEELPDLVGDVPASGGGLAGPVGDAGVMSS